MCSVFQDIALIPSVRYTRDMGLTVFASLASFLLKEWKSLYEIFVKVFSFATREKKIGSYENLNFFVRLELLDVEGRQVDFYKRQDLKFLEDNVKIFEDHMSGKGDPMPRYTCEPGKVVEVIEDGNRLKILIHFDYPKNLGDEEPIQIHTVFSDGFTSAREWFEVEILNITHHFAIEVVFPPARHCQIAAIQERRKKRTTMLEPEHFTVLPDGRQVVRWERNGKTNPLEVFTLKWDW